MCQDKRKPETLFGHIFGQNTGFLVTFTGRQARLCSDNARQNELTGIRQRSWSYPSKAEQAADYLLSEAGRDRDSYITVHLFRGSGTRRAACSAPTVRSLWLDEDDGHYPSDGPSPTAIVYSSANRRHLYWRLTHAVTIEWAVAMNRRIAHWAGGDIGKAALVTVLRVPGTMNYKRYPQVEPVIMETMDATLAWEPQVLNRAIPELPVSPRGTTKPYNGPELALEEFLAGVEILGEVADELGKKLAIVCPWMDEHSGGDRTGTFVGQRLGGGLWFCCHHAHCTGRTWRDFKREVRAKRMQITRPGYAGAGLEVTIYRG